MKSMNMFIFLSSILISIDGFSQQGKVYYDADNNVVKENASWSYYEIVTKVKGEKDHFWVHRYDENEHLSFEGTYLYKSKQRISKDGKSRYYFSNGIIESEGNFQNDNKSGQWTYWYSNGAIRLKTTIEPVDQKLTEVIEEYWSQDSIKTISDRSGTLTTYDNDGKMLDSGAYLNGVRDGLWINNKPSLRHYEEYTKGKIKRVYTYFEDSTLVYILGDKNAKPIGGYDNFYQTIRENINYPLDARRNGVQGKVYIQLFIQENGTVKDVSLLKDLGFGLGEEALRIVKLIPTWEPGEYQENKVPFLVTIPIMFKMN